ncbi:MAG: hypothetical protein ACYTF1_10360, partial [Planctomycetota bacterium]
QHAGGKDQITNGRNWYRTMSSAAGRLSQKHGGNGLGKSVILKEVPISCVARQRTRLHEYYDVGQQV